MIASKHPESFIDSFIDDYKFKLKGTGPLNYHLGCDYCHDADDKLLISPKKYINEIPQ